MKLSKNLSRTFSNIKAYPKKFARNARKRRLKYALISITSLIIVYLTISSFVILTFYSNKSLPNFYVSSVDVGGLRAEDVQAQLSSKLATVKIKLVLEDQKLEGTAEQLGLTINNEELSKAVRSRSIKQWLLPWFSSEKVDLPTNYNQEIAETYINQLDSPEFKAPKNASFTVKDDELIINEHASGVGVDTLQAMEDVKYAIGQELTDQELILEISELQPEVTKTDIEAIRETLANRLSKAYAYTVNNETTPVAKSQTAELITLHKLDDGSLEISADKKATSEFVSVLAAELETKPVNQVTNNYLSGREQNIATQGQNGRKVTNSEALANELHAKLNSGEPYTMVFEFEAIPFESVTVEVDDTVKATYTYNVEVWGSVSSDLAGFKSSAAETLAHANGWTGAGISFGEVASGGSFTLVLASPDRVAAASSGCSAEYSCRVGRYVIINDQRWQGATPSWNAAGGSLRDYRHMVVNHEVGHWLGFGHRSCTGAGQLAPVMLQQSISLEGCKFNPWPTQPELSSL